MSSENDVTGKYMEWLHYIVASQLEKHRKDSLEEKEENNDELAWQVFSLIGSYSISKYLNDEYILVLLPFMFLFMYFVIYKKLITRIIKYCKKNMGKFKGYKISEEDAKLINRVYNINGILINQVLLSNGFTEKYNDPDCSHSVKEFYLVEALHYLKNPLDEIHLIVTNENIFRKIIYINGDSEVLDKSIRIYRLIQILKIIEDILLFLNEHGKQIDFERDLINANDKFDVITKKLDSVYNIKYTEIGKSPVLE